MTSTFGLALIASTLAKVSPLYVSLNFASASARRSAAAVILINGNVEIGGRICVLATPRPAMPNRKTSLTESLSYFSVLSQEFAKQFPPQSSKNLPFPSLAKRGEVRGEKFPLEKGGKRGI